ncbi:hypothetical protein N4T20_02210 [Flavobacterium sp. TR2]|uniref:hypothetical protein n=1 Tax=Flavobacterium sp. TR2 TaxID=2977321 RepID=UPI0021B13DE8|nr:hypothetical protein [Flavobacterium sp. TR2]UWY28748.1 hypothetical protein N4T20_02210 [Flavobacterium sp. TR2]
MTAEQTKLLKQKNTLLRYKLIYELYRKYKTEDIPDSVVLRKYIKPIYPISRVTFDKILTTSINKKLQQIEELEKMKSR